VPRPRTSLLPRTVVPPAAAQIAALAAVAAIGTTAIAAAGGASSGVSAAADVHAAGVPVPVAPAAPALPVTRLGEPSLLKHAVIPKPAPAHHVVAPRHAKPVAAKRWMPTGTGMWIYQWNKTNGGRANVVVAKAKAAGLSTLYVRTGSTHDGFTGTGVLRALLPATRGQALHVVAWDFPELKHPAADARRLARAARVRVGGVTVAAVAPDIETPAEGTRTSPKRVRAYLSALRHLLPRNVAILTTVPWPSHARLGHYPYGTVANYSDAILPMAYWYNNPPALVTARSIAILRNYHRPVMPVGQGYDGKLDVPSLPHNNLRKQVPSFFATAHAMGAPAVSLWSWQSAPGASWAALSRARHWFPAHR
jgi:hypothetical protein